MLFSIVVPAYNVENYIGECVEGILKQSFSDFELILVDDGSTDGTAVLCDAYSSQNEVIRVIHQPNSGLSDARNAGLRVARGEYVVFVDGDDYIMPDSLKRFSEKLANRPDILITRLVEAYPDSSCRKMDEKMREDFETDKLSVLKWLFMESQNTWPSVKYIVNRHFVVEAGLRFSAGCLHEDIDWTSNLFRSASTFSYCCYYWYYHRINRSGAITSDSSVRRSLDVIDIVSKNIHDDRYQCLGAEMREVIFQRLVMSLFSSVVAPFFRYDSQDKKKVIAVLSEHTGLFDYAIRLKHRLFVALVGVLGLRAGLEITSFLFSKLSGSKRIQSGDCKMFG